MINTINPKQKLAGSLGPDSAALEKISENFSRTSEARVLDLEDFHAYPKSEEKISESQESPKQKDNYVEAFIKNKMVKKVFPDTMNWINIMGNIFSLSANLFGFSDGVKKFSKNLGAMCTKAFMVSSSVINIVERCYARNFLSALGYFNDIVIAGTIGQDDTYLARGTASGTYNMANSLTTSVGRETYSSVEDHVLSLVKAFKKFFKNFFSKNIIQNFLNHENGMWAIFGGLFSNIGALSWMFSGKVKVPTIIRDFAGVMMDIEQLNPGHFKSGRQNYFFSGVFLATGTICDLLMRMLPKFKGALVPLTFIFDGVGRHLLRLDQNERELKGLA